MITKEDSVVQMSEISFLCQSSWNLGAVWTTDLERSRINLNLRVLSVNDWKWPEIDRKVDLK